MSTVDKVTGESRYIQCGPTRLHILEFGAGEETLLVLPGITSPAATWAFVAERLAREQRVIVWDARGRGFSDHPPVGYTLEDYAADLGLLISALGLRRPALLGHSMGARILMYFAARHPDLTGPVIIADPPMMGPDRPPYPTALVGFMNELRKARVGELTLDELAHLWPTWDEQRLRERREWLPTCGEDAVSQTYLELEQDDILLSWRKLRGPLLLVRGSESKAITAQDEAELRSENPAARCAAVADAGHMIPYDNLEAFLDIVRQFLQSNRERPDT